MTPERWLRVGELFHEAVEIPTERRSDWLQNACAGDAELLTEVQSLLGSDHAAGEGFIAEQLKPAVVSLYEANTPAHPARVGPYRIVRELGRGGMGTVYLAERDDDQYQTKVAIKLVRRGMDTDLILQRFRRERQTLARLQHPHIARLLDGSTTGEGLPYIVMEYVDGSRINEYCAAHSLTTAQILSLFLDVSAAVEYAHRQFVVHRDLKPGNMLVDELGSVKLLDFGICKLLQASPAEGGETMEGGPPLLTPDYASPEQIRGDPIGVASDVYSLAAVLYELLTGVKPHKIEEYTLRGIEHGICETEVVRPSLAASTKLLARRLSGDLDTILLCGLQKDPARRYASVEQFSEDIRRHLTHQPVKARPDTLAYRIRKFVRRRRGLVAAVAAVILSLSAGVLVSLRSARIANENLQLVRNLSNTFVFDVHDAVRDLPGSTRARQLIVQTGLQYLDNLSRNSRGNPELQQELAAAYHRIGDVQGNVMSANLGNTSDALASYRKALALLEPLIRNDSTSRAALAEQITLHHRIADVHAYTRDANQALASYREAERLAVALLTRSPDDEHAGRQLAGVYVAAADVIRLSGDYTLALEKNSKALGLLKQYAEKHPADLALQSSLAAAYSAVGMCDVRLGRLKEGLEGYRQAAARMERVASLDPANVSSQRGLMFAYGHIGDVLGNPNLQNLGDAAGATEAYKQMATVARRIHESDPADQRAAGDYGVALARVAAAMPAERVSERVKILRESLQLHQDVARINPGNLSNRADLAFTHSLLGDALQGAGDGPNAVRAYEESLKLTESLLTAGSGSSVITAVALCRKLGEEAAARGDRRSAVTYAQRALQISDPSDPTAKGRPADLQRFLTPRGFAAMGLVHARIARTLRSSADTNEARPWLEKSLAAWRAVQTHPSFSPPHRREMQQVEAALSTLP
jgi:serine/threonine protein kinase